MDSSRRTFLRQAAAAGVVWPISIGRARSAEPIVCRLIDSETGQPVPARIRLVNQRGEEVVPLGHGRDLVDGAQQGDVRFQSRRYSYVNGEFRVDPAWLPLEYQVLKGYEYGIAAGDLTASPRGDANVTMALSRWSAVSKQGWYGGDIHIHHIAPKTCLLEMEAEDLNVANILTSDFTEDQDQFEGKLNAHSTAKSLIYVSQEYRHDSLGHMCVLNLKQLLQPVKPQQSDSYPLHLDACDRAHAQGGYVSWAHFPSMPGIESPLDVALEKLDGLEILCVLEPRELPVFANKMVPEMAADSGLRQWYRYLNCGFRLTATAGTDKMTTFVTVGANRVYGRIAGDFTYQSWIDTLKQGRTFVTNNPLLTFTVNGRESGSTLSLASGKDKILQIHARAESQLPYDRLEIICNGQVIGEAMPSSERHKA